MTEVLPVIQADRDAAAAIVRLGAPGVGNGNKVVASGIKGGLHDSYEIVQSFAKHRIAGQAELVEAAVRECAEIANRAYRTYSAPTDWDYGAQDACTFIEREILAALAPLSQSKGEG